MPTPDRVRALIALAEQGRIPEAIAEFYTKDAVMQENLGAPTVGRDANVERERGWLAGVRESHEFRADGFVVDGDRVAIRWINDFTGADGVRYRFDEIAWQTWRGDRVASERFYYDSASLVVAPAAGPGGAAPAAAAAAAA